MAYLEYFPEAFIQLQKEVLNHPILMDRLSKHHDVDAELQFSKCLAEISAYCNVALDDTYNESDMIKIADICIVRLRGRRVGNVSIPTPPLGLVDINGNPIASSNKPESQPH